MTLALITASDDAAQLIHDAIAQHSTAGYVVAGLAAVLFLVPLVLKALGRSIPFLDPIIEVAISVLKSFATAKKPTPEEIAAAKAEQAAEPGVEKVANVVELKPKDPQ